VSLAVAASWGNHRWVPLFIAKGLPALAPRLAPQNLVSPSTGSDLDSIRRRTRCDLDDVAFLPLAGHTGVVTADQLEMISTDPRVMHGQAVIVGTRVPVSVILDCLAAGMTAEEITAEYPSVTVAGVRAAAAYGAALAR
jgi:uncharacterized protein (DUF433 family)